MSARVIYAVKIGNKLAADQRIQAVDLFAYSNGLSKADIDRIRREALDHARANEPGATIFRILDLMEERIRAHVDQISGGSGS